MDMINLRELIINNSVKAARKLYIPKSYLAALVLRHKGEKASSVFKIFMDIFGSNNAYRAGYDAFIDENFNLGDVKRILSLKDGCFENISLSEDYPFTSSLINGLQTIKAILGGIDLANINDEVLRRIMEIRISQVRDVCSSNKILNCGLDQGMFDFVIARECLINQKMMNAGEIADVFFQLVIFNDAFNQLINNVKEENAFNCLKTLRMLSLNTYDPRFELESLRHLEEIGISDLFYYVGTNINILINVLNYYSEAPEDVLPELFNNYLSSLDSDVVDVLNRRGQGETLDSIGKTYGVTRERIRQIEEVKGVNPFNEFYLENFSSDTKNLIFVFPKVSGVFPLNSFKDKLGSNYDCFRVLMESIKYAGDAKYYPELDAVVENGDIFNFFETIAGDILGMYFKKSDLDSKISECLESVAGYGFDYETIKNYIYSTYKEREHIFTNIKDGKRFSNVFQINVILENNFDDGFHFSDEEQIRKLNALALDEFGEELFTEKDILSSDHHTVQANVERCDVRLIDRGTYIHVSKAVDLPMELVEKIINYLKERNDAVPYIDILNTFKDEFTEIGINNRYALQGAMSIYEGELFKGKRDYVTPVEMTQTLRDSICTWMLSRPGLFSYDDFVKEFKGVAMSVFMSAIYEVGNLAYFWQQGYIHMSKFNISDVEKASLKQLIDYRINQYHMEYCSADEIFELVNIQMHAFVERCGMKYSYDLFSVLQILFANEYKFKRPLLGSKDAVFETSSEIIDGYLASKNIVKFDKLRKYVDAKTGHNADVYVTVFEILKNKWNEFVAIDSNTMFRKEIVNISDREIIRLDVIIEMLLEEKETINIEEDIVQRFFFKELAKMPVNKYLVFGLVNTYLHDKYEACMDSKMYKHGDFSITNRKA